MRSFQVSFVGKELSEEKSVDKAEWKTLMTVKTEEGEKFYKVLRTTTRRGLKYLFCSKIKNNKVHAVMAVECPDGRATNFTIGRSWLPKRIVDLFIWVYMSSTNVEEIDPTKEGVFSF